MSRTRGTSKGFRLHIGIFGRRNVGKSSLLNAVTRQATAIVSEMAGTTTDPVEKPMELLPLGPVLFIDTAGLDDPGALGALRVEKTRSVVERTDLALLVCVAGEWGEYEEELLTRFEERGIPVVIVMNKCDEAEPPPELMAELEKRDLPLLRFIASRGEGVEDLRAALVDAAPSDFIDSPLLLRDLVDPGDLVVLVTPIDKEAPRGRLIMPQVQAIRDLLDGDAYCLVVKERELPAALANLKSPPRLVLTDSQAFREVAAVTPPEIALTGFSILFSRFRGDLSAQVAGALAIETLVPGDRILVAESCSHHPIEDDIGRVKLPRWLREYVGGELIFDTVQGHDYPDDLSPYALVVHCGACTFNRRAMLNRIQACRMAGVPITNYGLAIAYSLGIFERALAPFPAALEVYRERRARKS